MKKLIGALFTISFILCGCGIESIFGTTEQRVTWLALFTVMVISVILLGER